MGVRTVLAIACAAVLLAGCAQMPGAQTPVNTWPSEPELLPPAVPPAANRQASCAGPAFDAAVLDGPAGAEKRAGPEYDALRASIEMFGTEFPQARDLTWRLVARNEDLIAFLANVDAEFGWLEIDVERAGPGWRPQGITQCQLNVAFRAEFGLAFWTLDPRYPPPTRVTTALNILVSERACASGRPTTGRMLPPVIELQPESVIITVGVRPLEGVQTCPGPPGTPAIVQLPEALGDRELLDGAHVPPRPPEPNP